MKMIKTISMFILLFTGYLCNAQEEEETTTEYKFHTETEHDLSPRKVDGKHTQNSSPTSAPKTQGRVPAGRSLPTLVVAGVSIALVLLFVLIVAVFWYAWKKSQEGSIELNPIPYGETGVSLRTVPVPGN